MPRVTPPDNENFPRVNTRITRAALDRLNYACEVRERREPRICPQGTILTELIMEHLGPTPEQRGNEKVEAQPARKRVKSIRRATAGPKSMTA